MKPERFQKASGNPGISRKPYEMKKVLNYKNAYASGSFAGGVACIIRNPGIKSILSYIKKQVKKPSYLYIEEKVNLLVKK